MNCAKAQALASELLRHALVVGLLGYANFADRLLRPLEASHGAAVQALRAMLYRRATLRYLPMPNMPHVTHGAGY